MSFKVVVPDASLEFDKKFLKRCLRQAGAQVIKVAKGLIKTGTKGTPSQPGEAPNSQTGDLLKNLKVKSGRGLSVTVSDLAFYALALESGAVGGGGPEGNKNKVTGRGKNRKVVQASTKRVLDPRPFLSTALDSQEANIADQMARAIEQGIDLKTLSKSKT